MSFPRSGYPAHISLYDHLKTTAAIASCSYLFDNESDSKDKNKFIIINGDISGIQKFIYRVSSPQEAQSGMSKRLRGRSIYISLLNEDIASKNEFSKVRIQKEDDIDE